jgi:hypothetical protein
VKLVGKSSEIIFKKCVVVKYKAPFNSYMQYPYFQEYSVMIFRNKLRMAVGLLVHDFSLSTGPY